MAVGVPVGGAFGVLLCFMALASLLLIPAALIGVAIWLTARRHAWMNRMEQHAQANAGRVREPAGPGATGTSTPRR